MPDKAPYGDPTPRPKARGDIAGRVLSAMNAQTAMERGELTDVPAGTFPLRVITQDDYPRATDIEAKQRRVAEPRFDAVGLFTQWLAERISLLDPMPPWTITVNTLHVILEVLAPDGFELTHTWAVSWLNDQMHMNGGGEKLRAVIRDCAMDVANNLEHHRTGE